jgi:hypothetical protein
MVRQNRNTKLKNDDAILIKNNIISTLENKQTDETTQSKIKQTKRGKSLDNNNLKKKRASDVIYFLLCHGVCV